MSHKWSWGQGQRHERPWGVLDLLSPGIPSATQVSPGVPCAPHPLSPPSAPTNAPRASVPTSPQRRGMSPPVPPTPGCPRPRGVPADVPVSPQRSSLLPDEDNVVRLQEELQALALREAEAVKSLTELQQQVKDLSDSWQVRPPQSPPGHPSPLSQCLGALLATRGPFVATWGSSRPPGALILMPGFTLGHSSPLS